MTFQPPASQLFASALSIPLFLQRALNGAGFKEVADFDGVAAEELCDELKIGRNEAEDLIRQVESFRAGPSRSRITPSQLAPSSAVYRSSPHLTQPHPLSQSVATLLHQRTAGGIIASGSAALNGLANDGSGRAERTAGVKAPQHRGWSTGCKEIDRLIDSAVLSGGGMMKSSAAAQPLHGTARALLDTIPSAPVTEAGAESLASNKGQTTKRAIGVRPGMILEVASPPGGGKTSLVVGLAIEARRGLTNDTEERADESEREEDRVEVLIVDTEGSVQPMRMSQAIEAMTRSTAESPMIIQEGIHLMRIISQTELVAFLHTVDEWLYGHPKVKLVIIDTLSFHLRHPNMDLNSRKRIMELVKQKIAKASTVNGCAIVIANQMATKLLTAENKPANFDTGDKAILMPQLGDSWVTPKTLRLSLFRSGPMPGRRFAHLQASSPNAAELPWAPFEISVDGLLQDEVAAG